MQVIWQRLEKFLFPAAADTWLVILRLGLGVQVTLYSLSIRADWNNLFAENDTGFISRDLTETILTLDSRLIPRLGWLVAMGNHVGFSEEKVLWAVWICLLCASCCLVLGLLCRPAAMTTWFLHLCAVKSGNFLAYGMDNFTTIGLFYLMLAPLPDRCALDSRIWKPRPKDPCLQGFFQRVLQLHLCVVYLFTGLTKSLGSEWWNGTSIWRSLTCPPFNVISPNTLVSWRPLLPAVGIAVLVFEIGYPIFIWLRKTRLVWFLAIIAMHMAIAITMGLYLFAFVMIVLNVAAFGPDVLPFLNKITLSNANDAPAHEPDLIRATE